MLLRILFCTLMLAQYNPDKFENKDIFAPWNNPMHQDDIRQPWNDPVQKDDIFAPWNRQVTTEQENKQYFYEHNRDKIKLWEDE